MASNGLTIANGAADIEIYDGTDTNGYKYAKGSQVVETRGSAFVGQIATGGTTYQDAEPFKRKVYDNFLGGMGQESDNKTFGGTGIGGDDSKYFYGDCYTLRGGYLLPGMSRNLIYNQITAGKTPISDGLDPLGGDEQEVPRGVLPCSLPINSGNTNYYQNSFTTTSVAPSINNIRVLIQIRESPYNMSGYTAVAEIYTTGGASQAKFTYSITTPDMPTFTGFRWVTCAFVSGTAALSASTSYNIRFYTPDSLSSMAIGCYIGNTNAINPYFQLMTSATPFKYFANPLQKVEHITNGSTYTNIGLHSTGMFNLGNTSTGGSAITSPERLFSAGTYTSSVWLNSLLYVSTTSGIGTWDYTQAAGNLGPTTAIDTGGKLQSMVAYDGKIYGIGVGASSLWRWDLTFPIVGGTNMINIMLANTIGYKGTAINTLFVFRGNLWAAKPEGLFQLYADPSIITTDPGNTPRINQIGEGYPSVHTDTGKFLCIHQGMIYLNYRDRLYQYTVTDTGVQVSVLSLPMPWYRLSYYHYINGISSDGVNLYVSFNNLGVFSYTNQTWHPITEFYETVAAEGQRSGLAWYPAPLGGPDNLFVGDGKTIVQLPIPSAAAPYTNQIFQNNQNKAGYLITSAWDGDLAEVQKYIHSLVIRAVPSGYSYKVVAVAWQSSDTPGFKTLLEKTFQQGIIRDNWINPNYPTVVWARQVATKQLDFNTGTLLNNTLAPACWAYTDFNNVFYSSEKLAAQTTDTTATPDTTDVLTNPPKFVKTAFIIYFWNPVASQHATTSVGVDLMAIDSLVVKYQPPLDYIAAYQLTVDFRSSASGTKPTSRTRTPAQIDTDAEWLRSKTGAHQPVQVTMKLNGTTTKTFLAFLQNPTTTYGRTSEQAKGLVVDKKSLNIISVQAEYESV